MIADRSLCNSERGAGRQSLAHWGDHPCWDVDSNSAIEPLATTQARSGPSAHRDVTDGTTPDAERGSAEEDRRLESGLAYFSNLCQFVQPNVCLAGNGNSRVAWLCSYENLSVHNCSLSDSSSVGSVAVIRIEETSYCYNCFSGKPDGQARDLLRIRTVGAAQLA